MATCSNSEAIADELAFGGKQGKAAHPDFVGPQLAGFGPDDGEYGRCRGSFPGGLSCEQLAGQMRAISAYQQQLTEKMTRIRIRKFRHGLLAKPWLHRSLRRTFSS